MAESEKMVALKKAYADIILNTAKEAAARIMVSESKAVRVEKDLRSTKDEAVRLLLHLKQMIDSTTMEAEITTVTKQRKIDELEAQLNEAEDVITDLRSELRWVRGKLEKVKTNPVQLRNGQMAKEDECSHENEKVEPIIPSTSNSHHEAVNVSDMENSSLNFLDNRCCNTTQQTEPIIPSSVSHLKPDDHTPNLASTIMRSKEPEPYRNGCTQRIHALESILLNGKLSQLGDEDGQCTPVKNELMIETIDKAVGKCAAPSPKMENIYITKKFSGGEVKKPIKVLTSRRRKTRFGKAKASVRRSRPGQPKKPSVPSRCKTFSVNGNVRSVVSARTPPSIKAGNLRNVKICRDLDEKLLQKRSFNEEEIKISQKGKENVRVQSRDASETSGVSPPSQLIKPCQPSSVVNRGVIYSFARRGNVKFGEDGLRTADNEAKMKPLLRLDPGLTLIRSGVDPVSGSKNITVSVKALNTSRLVQKSEEKDRELRSESALVKPDGGAVEDSMIKCSELSHEVVNIPVLSDSRDAKSSVEPGGSPSKPDCNRVLKYTFQRKRKKESTSNSGENTSPDNAILKRREIETQNDSLEPEKSTLINESSRDNRRMAQVARQLISLSGRRW